MKYFINFTTFLIFVNIFLKFLLTVPSITEDLGRHLVLGGIILNSGTVPSTSLLTYPFPEIPFINLHWLSEAIFYLINNLFGINGLLVLATVLGLASFAITYFITKRYIKLEFKDTLIFNVISLLYLGIILERTSIRPELFSFLFLSTFIAVLYKYKATYTNLIFLLIFLEIIWVNIHFYFITGVIVVGLFFLDQLLINKENLILFLKHKQKLNKKLAQLFFVFFGVILATLLNPNTYKGALYPFYFFKSYPIVVAENVNIFARQSFPNSSPAIIYLEIAVVLFFLLYITSKKKQLIDLFLYLSFGILAVMAIRNLPLFAFATFLGFTKYATEAIGKIKLSNKIEIYFLSVLTIIFSSLLFFQIKYLISNRDTYIDLQSSPKRAMDFFEKNNLKGPIFNNYNIGSYISYRLYPKEMAFIDERPELLSNDFINHVYNPMQLDIKNFNIVARYYGFNAVILRYTRDYYYFHLLKNLINSDNWKLVYLNDDVLIFLKNNIENKFLINKFLIPRENPKIDGISKNTGDLFKLVVVFDQFGWYDSERKILNKILDIDSSNCLALQQLIQISSSGTIDIRSIYLNKYNIVCGQLLLN